MRSRILFVCAALIASPASPASAFEWVNVGIWGNGILSQQALRNAQDRTNSANDRKSRDARPKAEQRGTGRDANLPFKRSTELTGEIERAVATRLNEVVSLRFRMDRASDFVNSANARSVYKRELAARRLPTDTVGGATALFLAVGWEMVNGQKLSPAQNAAIFRQTATGLRSTPLAQQSDAQRQQEAEMRLLISSLWLEESRSRSTSPRLMREMADVVRRDLMTITGNDMRTYAVTNAGFATR